jgi:hypothetical protein
MKMRIILLISLFVIEVVLSMKIATLKEKKNSNNVNDKLNSQESKIEKIGTQLTTDNKGTLKPVDSISKTQGEKSEEDLYELERANAMAEMIF